ncbi:MAG: DUF883 domain-containing protein [Betaproteobacteria bacterium]|nr:DUF883 domain-containing protein [Betaproteobacteria bacterium]
MNPSLDVQKDQLIQDLRAVMRDAEELFKSSGHQLGDGAVQWRERAQNRLSELREELSALQHQTAERVASTGRNANAFVHRNPWAAVGMASGLGILAGLLLNSRR